MVGCFCLRFPPSTKPTQRHKLRSVSVSVSVPVPVPESFADGLPWLLMPSHHVDNESELSLVPLLEDKHSVRLPFLPNTPGKAWCVGHKDGWLIVLHALKLSLLNPITREQVTFPPLAAQPGIDHDFVPILRKVVLSDTGNGAITAMAITRSRDIAYAKSTDRNWTHMEVAADNHVCDIVYHFGAFCVLCSGPEVCEFANGFVGEYWHSQLTMLRFDGPEPSRDQYAYVDELGDSRICLVSSPTGDLLLVLEIEDPESVGKFEVKVFRPEVSACWVEVEGLGDQCLFVDSLQSSIVPATDGSALKGNRAYFANVVAGPTNELVVDSGVFDFGSGTVEPCFPSGLQLKPSSAAVPFWFTPSPSV